jgi:predicted TIM-barrel fold metal-dependent hydrolase
MTGVESSGAPPSARTAEVVDAHTHVACGDDPRFPFRPTGVGSGWASEGGSAHALLGEMDAGGVARAVVVQAVGVYGYDARCAARAVAEHPARFAFVAAVDLASPDPARDLVAAVAGAEVRPVAVRLFGVGVDGAAALHDARATEIWRAAAELSVGLVTCTFAADLDAVAVAAEAEPGVAVAVDHCGFPDRDGADGWAALDRLAAVASVSLKVTSYVLEAAERDDGDPAAAVERLGSAFGADRLCWGSDHPQDLTRSYPGKRALAEHATRDLDAAARRSFFGELAARLWFAAGPPVHGPSTG